MAVSSWPRWIFATAPKGDVGAGGRVRATFLTLVAVILTQVGVMVLFEMVQYGQSGVSQHPYLTGLILAVDWFHPDGDVYSFSAATNYFLQGFVFTVVATFVTWVQYWALLLATLWLPVRWRKARWVIWSVHLGLAVLVIGRLVATGALAGIVVVEICRSLVIQVMGMTALYREVIPSGRLRLVEWVMYLGLAVCVVIAGVWAIVVFG